MSAGMGGFYNGAQRRWSDYPTRAPLLHDESTVLRGNSLTRVVSTSQKYGVYSSQTPAALGDQFCLTFSLRAGLYTLSILGVSDPGAGIVQWTLDDEGIVAGQDWYSAATTYNVIKTSSLTIRTSGNHLLRGQIVGRNASASGYSLYLTKVSFMPPAQEVW